MHEVELGLQEPVMTCSRHERRLGHYGCYTTCTNRIFVFRMNRLWRSMLKPSRKIVLLHRARFSTGCSLIASLRMTASDTMTVLVVISMLLQRTILE